MLIDCPECKRQVSNQAKSCPHCGHPLKASGREPSTPVQSQGGTPERHGRRNGWVIAGVLVALVLIASQLGNKQSNTTRPEATASTATSVTDSLGRPVAPDVTDDASLLLSRCGRPSKDDSTAYDNPRPPIPSRIIEYARQKLRFAFVPGSGAKLGDPPPYQWKFIGVMDMTARDPSKARVVPVDEAVARMPCWGGK